MKVARQFIAWNTAKNDPNGRGRCVRDVDVEEGQGGKPLDCELNHTVPYGTGRLCGVFQAINCLATIIRSLRDVGVHPLHGLTATTPSRRHADTLLRDGFEIIFPSFFADRYELFAFTNATRTYIKMNRFCVRITFPN